MTTRAAAQRAIKSFLAGKKPPSFRQSRYWFVLGPEGELLPAKAIWSLIIGSRGADFNTTHAVKGLFALGYSVIDIRHSHGLKSFDKQVVESLERSAAQRRERLAIASRTPRKILVVIEQYSRNPDVVAEVLSRAKGRCERCKESAPFKRRVDDSPYLEVHHRKQLSDGGEDTVANAIALCPNCHRFAHHGYSSKIESKLSGP